MTDKPEVGEETQTNWAKYDFKESSRVVNPHTVSPATADFCMVAYMGRDFDLSFFSLQPSFLAFGGFQPDAVGPRTTEARQDYVQTARIRLSAPAAAHVVGNLMMNLKQADSEVFNSTVESLKALIDAKVGNEGAE